MRLIVRAANLRSLLCPQRASFSPSQYRAIHLWKAAVQREPIGNHGVKEIRAFGRRYQDPKRISLKLWAEPPSKKGAPEYIGTTTLDVALKSHIESGVLLAPLEDHKTKTIRPGHYILCHINKERLPAKRIRNTKNRGSKQIHFTDRNPLAMACT